jgi:hypothetical protein
MVRPLHLNSCPNHKPVRHSINVRVLVHYKFAQAVAIPASLTENLSIILGARIASYQHRNLSTTPTVRLATRVVADELAHNEGRVVVVGLFIVLGVVETNQRNMARDSSRDIFVERREHTAGLRPFGGVGGHLLRSGVVFLLRNRGLFTWSDMLQWKKSFSGNIIYSVSMIAGTCI